MSHAIQSPLTPTGNKHQQEASTILHISRVAMCLDLGGAFKWPNRESFRSVSDKLGRGWTGGPPGRGGGSRAPGLSVDSSHVRRPHFSGVFYPVFAQRQDRFTYRGKENGLMISGVDMRLYHV
ncbi:hypothetical protein BDA96_03G402700 [Sorghum bicolor]|jgi:hypothetical protein|uniref:Uncharacterized protein n=2 Tax=Sorghum bicolor TaxID=4558 RepID=A0A921RJ67_SORBI|nr:hypothetical protein BDA96_03G402700 [Sorghum bicolor]OQU87962.1 hypothetical protein SORBI_3003G373150 [Sorghum bicolor]